MIQVIVFDFDGVILDTTDTKDHAFLTLFCDVDPEASEKAINFITKTRGQFRRQRILDGFREVLGQSLTEPELDKQYSKFSNIVVNASIQAYFITGALEFFRSEHNRNLYIVSAAPEDEVRFVCEQRNLSHFFLDILGGPFKKTEHLKSISKKEKATKDTMLFIGDSISDYHAALHSRSTQFLGIVPVEQQNIFPDTVEVTHSLKNLSDYL